MFRYGFDKHLKELGVQENSTILAAVSGGVDSMCMLDALQNSSLGLKVSVVHVNFMLRSDESDADTKMVEDYCKQTNTELFVEYFNTEQYAAQNKISIEMAARDLRYALFNKLMQEKGFNYLSIAHNANDNAETLMLNLVRGSGIEGICGINSKDSYIIRPLLIYTRKKIEKYALKYKIPYRTDSTNLQSVYARNRIRNEVFPQLEKINPSVIDTFNTDINHFRDAAKILNSISKEKQEKLCVTFKDFKQYLSSNYAKSLANINALMNRNNTNDSCLLECLIELPQLINESNWEFWLYNILKTYNFSSPVIEDITKAIKEEAGTKIFLSGRKNEEKICALERNTLKIYNNSHNIHKSSKPLVLNNLEELLNFNAFGNLKFRCKILEAEEFKNTNFKLCTVLDLNKIIFPLTVRAVCKGDKFSPYGLKGTKKISDYLNNLKFELIHKQHVPIICNKDGKIICIPALQIDNSVKISKLTTNYISISSL